MDVAGATATSSSGGSSGNGNGSVSTAALAAALAHAQSMQVHALTAVSVNSGGDIDSLLAANGSSIAKTTASHQQHLQQQQQQKRRVFEPYEQHRAHDLRAECYRRGLRPIKKGPHANDNKSGYILLLRQDDSAAVASNAISNGVVNVQRVDQSSITGSVSSGSGGEHILRRHESSDEQHELASAAKKRKLPLQQQRSCGSADSSGTSTPTSADSGENAVNASDSSAANGAASGSLDTVSSAAAAAAAAAAATPGVADLTSFYESGQSQSSLASALPALQYASLPKPTNLTTDLEILSGIANTYTQNAGGDAVQQQLCSSCRTVVTDQLMESIRFGKSKMQLHEFQRALEQRERDTLHLQHVLRTLAELRQSHRDAQRDGARSRELLAELEDDIAFFVGLKERTKERMRVAMQDSGGARGGGGSQALGGGASNVSGASSSGAP